MNQVVSRGIVLSRTNFGEADRIITMITPDQGKLRLMAKGVRRIKSKLAGGIELFSVSDITYIVGKGDMHTLVSTRLKTHYSQIAKDINRTMLGYEFLKRLNRATEDAAESGYFDLLQTTMGALNEGVPSDLLELWFDARLLSLSGHQPGLTMDNSGQRLQADQRYSFDFENVAFAPVEQGSLTTNHIKFLRLIFGVEQPAQLQQINGINKLIGDCHQLVGTMRREYIRV